MFGIISSWKEYSSLGEDFFHHIVIGEIIFKGELGNVNPMYLITKHKVNQSSELHWCTIKMEK